MRLIFDIETDGFLDIFTKIHCIAIMNRDDPSQTWVYGPDKIEQGVQQLQAASEITAHNGLAFDIPCLQKIYPNFTTKNIKVIDTLVMSRLMRPHIREDDFATDLPKKLRGSHSLKAWGLRLGVLKGDFGDTADWSAWSQEMQDYCERDVVCNHAVLNALASDTWSQKAIDFEHDVAAVCHEIGNRGWTFDIDKAAKLYGDLSQERSEIEERLHELFPAWTVEEEFIPKRNNKRLGYEEGVPFIKHKPITFNPNSRKHIEFCLRQKYNWKPKVFTANSGDAKIDETTLSALPFPEAQELARSFMLQKRLGMLAEGNNAWMKLVGKDGKLRHTINSLGCISGRCSSFGPNLQQVPAVRAEFGKECRELFTVQPGYELVGADLSGIELRCLAHYLQDDGAYAREILEGDIHSANAKAFGTNRDEAKTAIYCMIYGGGDRKLGESVGGSAKDGRQLRDNFYRNNPAFKNLLMAIKEVIRQKGYLTGLDGRQIIARSEHGQLNILLQSAAAVIAKQWVLLVDKEIKQQQLDASIIAFVHDEIQVQVRNQGADYVGHLSVRCAEEVGKKVNFKTPIAAEYSVGRTWADTH